MFSKVIIASDSFKGTISSVRAGELAAEAIHERYPDCETVIIPIADGGEGTTECFIRAQGFERRTCVIHPQVCARSECPTNLHEYEITSEKKIYEGDVQCQECPIISKKGVEAFYAVKGEAAVIEMAVAAGLNKDPNKRDIMHSSTYGVGEMIADAVRGGAKNILIGLGGSGTNDGGCGMAAALGVRFLSKKGVSYVPTGATLSDLGSIDTTEADKLLEGVSFTAMCDVTNPLCGKRGAAHVFGPQKGATPEQVEELDEGLRHLAEVMERDCAGRHDAHTSNAADEVESDTPYSTEYRYLAELGYPEEESDGQRSKRTIADMPGAGAAGGMGAGCSVFLKARRCSGIDAILDLTGFNTAIKGADAVITGEGRLDSQSLGGKVISGISRRTAKAKVPLVVIAGTAETGDADISSFGVRALYETNYLHKPFEEIKDNAEQDYSAAVMRFINDCEHED